MAHRLFQAYTTKGVDTRTNRLAMDPLSLREGTQNIIVDHNADLTQRYGFGHIDAGGYVSLGEVEYKFTDPDSGELSTQILQVRSDGNLYRRLEKNGLTISLSHSLYFDGVTFSLVVGATTITFGETKTLLQLSTDLTTAGIAHTVLGLNTTPAYLLGTFVNETGSHYATSWEIVPFPNAGTSVPFPEVLGSTLALEGVGFVNLNNVIYLTVGGFPLKYDGKMVYRAGVPKSLEANTLQDITLSGNSVVNGTTTNTALPNGVYYYSFQFGFRDAVGATYWGAVDASQQNGTNTVRHTTTGGANNAALLGVKNWLYGKDFGAASCIINGNQAAVSGPQTITVDSGHNVIAGMCLMQPVYGLNLGAPGNQRTTSTFYGYYAAKVSSVTATSITLETAIPTVATPSITGTWIDNTLVGAAFVEPLFENKYLIDYISGGSGLSKDSAQEPFGAFVRVYRSKINAPDVLYRVIDLPVPYQSDLGAALTNPWDPVYTFVDDQQDTLLIENFVDNPTGAELPRACRYLTDWQDTIIQAGRPADTTLKDDIVPSWADFPITDSGINGDAVFLSRIYTEAGLCDAQSIYWADQNNLEGFPRNGRFENRIDTTFSDQIKGIKQNKDVLFAFKQRSTAILRGSLGENDLVLEILETDAGCLDHRSIQDVEGSLIWCDSDKGFWACVAGRLPVHIGKPIADQFQNGDIIKTFAVAANWARRDLYICYLSNAAFAFDYSDARNIWYPWSSGYKSVLASADDGFYLSDGTRFWKAKDTLTNWDCSDYKSAIPMRSYGAWLNFKSPTIDKKYHRVWVNSIQGDFTLKVRQFGNYLQTQLGEISVNFLAEANKKFIKKEIKTNMEKLSSLSVGFAHDTAAERVKIQGWELEYSADYDLGEPKD